MLGGVWKGTVERWTGGGCGGGESGGKGVENGSWVDVPLGMNWRDVMSKGDVEPIGPVLGRAVTMEEMNEVRTISISPSTDYDI